MNGRIDVGSFEVQGPTPTPTPTATPCASVGSWTEQSPYPIAISGQAVASVGGNVYSFGGIVNNTAIANAYKYTPATNTWTPIASLPAPRGWFSGTSDGTYIYLLGGVDQNFNTTATLWRYDPISNTYNTSLPSYTIPTYFHASAYLNGKIYRIAGRAIGTDFHVEVYDIATNTWSMAANYPFANHSLMAAALGSYIYAGGGNASPDKTYRQRLPRQLSLRSKHRHLGRCRNRRSACGPLGCRLRSLQRQMATRRRRRQLRHQH